MNTRQTRLGKRKKNTYRVYHTIPTQTPKSRKTGDPRLAQIAHKTSDRRQPTTHARSNTHTQQLHTHQKKKKKKREPAKKSGESQTEIHRTTSEFQVRPIIPNFALFWAPENNLHQLIVRNRGPGGLELVSGISVEPRHCFGRYAGRGLSGVNLLRYYDSMRLSSPGTALIEYFVSKRVDIQARKYSTIILAGSRRGKVVVQNYCPELSMHQDDEDLVVEITLFPPG
ncbi:hypothetical protein L873DRAFT_111123 [Choiromyces venosus 120613-1]|uniref:Uncharacterized protein n=1 Tax=Choiromyces venosus 120613-1 TaxID=1336337 RepID=A0A3N4J3Z1_9PEZI|nr:hypothetical protein L873DRAFT_111123 [Choiromyces venosus 120613-1]